jgi:hypothetical protein
VKICSKSRADRKATHKSGRRFDECLGTAWEHVEGLHRAFEPWGQKKTKEQVKEILRSHIQHISKLELIKVDAVGLEDIN